MAAPPLEADAVQLTEADVADEVADTVAPVGALAVVAGMAAADGLEAALVPAALVAVTVKV
jgi:hypothetical protein